MPRLVVDPKDSSILYAEPAPTSDVYRSADRGKTWTRFQNLRGVTISQSNPSVVYALNEGANLRKSVDRGKTWKAVATNLKDGYVSSLTVSPSDANVLFVTQSVNDTSASGSTYRTQIARSTDGGKTWTPLTLPSGTLANNADCASLVFSPSGKALFATIKCDGGCGGGPTYDARVLRSEDLGKTWKVVLRLEDSGDGVTDLSYSLPAGAEVYVATSRSGIYRSADGGKTFAFIGKPGTGEADRRLTLDRANPQTLYARLPGDNRGAVWTYTVKKAAPAATPTAQPKQTPTSLPTAVASPTQAPEPTPTIPATPTVEAASTSVPTPTAEPTATVEPTPESPPIAEVVSAPTPTPDSVPPAEPNPFGSAAIAVGGAAVLTAGALVGRRFWHGR